MPKGYFRCGFAGCGCLITPRQRSKHMLEAHDIDISGMTPAEFEALFKAHRLYTNPLLECCIAATPKAYNYKR